MGEFEHVGVDPDAVLGETDIETVIDAEETVPTHYERDDVTALFADLSSVAVETEPAAESPSPAVTDSSTEPSSPRAARETPAGIDGIDTVFEELEAAAESVSEPLEETPVSSLGLEAAADELLAEDSFVWQTERE